MESKGLRSIAIIGGGIGGLTLAQLIKDSGIKVTVYERDQSSESRDQGVCISLLRGAQKKINSVTEKCLNSYLIVSGSVVLDHHLKNVISESKYQSMLINRYKLREALMENVSIEWNKKFSKYEEFEDKVVIYFEDGSVVEADFLVGADGINSLIRQQRCPDIEVEKVMTLAISGTLPYADVVDRLDILKSYLNQRFVRICGNDGHNIFCFTYLVFGVMHILWHISWQAREDDNVPNENNEALKECAIRKARNLSNEIEILVRMTPIETLQPPRITYTSNLSNNPLGKTTRVSLLGDAAHPMTPDRGIGANTAILDASDLASAIQEMNWRESVSQYEEKMTKRARENVEKALKQTYSIHGMIKD